MKGYGTNLPPGVSVSDLPGHSDAEMWLERRVDDLLCSGLEWDEAVQQAQQEWKER